MRGSSASPYRSARMENFLPTNPVMLRGQPRALRVVEVSKEESTAEMGATLVRAAFMNARGVKPIHPHKGDHKTRSATWGSMPLAKI